ncbi:hypothetical protein [Embleya sp. AB8]
MGGGETIETPATTAGIREVLPEDQRDEFTKTIEAIPASRSSNMCQES